STAINLTTEVDYGDPDLEPRTEDAFNIAGGGGFWESAVWDEFFWSAPYQGRAESYEVGGIGRNLAIGVLSNHTYERPHILSALTVHFNYRRQVR
ncbi:MAG: hypothetical protein AAF264_08245, partial [Pseudomonadota bacterium]